MEFDLSHRQLKCRANCFMYVCEVEMKISLFLL